MLDLLEGFEPYQFKKLPKVSFGYYGVTFNSGVIDGLSNPSYVQILLNSEEKKMAVRKCEEWERCAVEVKFMSNTRMWRINCTDFNKAIADMTGFNRDACTRSVVGTYYPEEKTYIFDLSSADFE